MANLLPAASHDVAEILVEFSRVIAADGVRYHAQACGAPMLMHLGELDEFIPSAAQAHIKVALAGKPNVEIHSYPGC